MPIDWTAPLEFATREDRAIWPNVKLLHTLSGDYLPRVVVAADSKGRDAVLFFSEDGTGDRGTLRNVPGNALGRAAFFGYHKQRQRAFDDYKIAVDWAEANQNLWIAAAWAAIKEYESSEGSSEADSPAKEKT